MSTNDNTSTLGSYIDSAKGAAQSMLGSITGNQADKTSGEATRTKAQHEKAASDSVAKLGPIGISPAGGVSADSPDRAEGSWNQTIGSGKEMVGNALGAEGLKREGAEQNRLGKGQEAQGQLSDFGSGVGDRVQGKVGAVVAGVTGDREREERERVRHEGGKTLQRSAEKGMEKSADY